MSTTNTNTTDAPNITYAAQVGDIGYTIEVEWSESGVMNDIAGRRLSLDLFNQLASQAAYEHAQRHGYHAQCYDKTAFIVRRSDCLEPYNGRLDINWNNRELLPHVKGFARVVIERHRAGTLPSYYTAEHVAGLADWLEFWERF